MSTIVALVKVGLWPSQAQIYKQEVVERVILFAQTLFTRHANCAHLGEWGLGNFKTNQVSVSVYFKFQPVLIWFAIGSQLKCNPWIGTSICSRREHGARAELWHDGKSVSYMDICHWSNELIRHSSHREEI